MLFIIVKEVNFELGIYYFKFIVDLKVFCECVLDVF